MLFHRQSKKDPAALEALQEADKNLKKVKARDKEVHDVAESLRKVRSRNHFAERIQEIMEGGPKK